LGVTLCAFAFAGRSRAETTWLQPERFSATPGAFLILQIRSSDVFGELEDSARSRSPLRGAANGDRAASVNDPTPMTVVEADAQLSGGPVALSASAVVGAATQFSATLPRPGVAVVHASLKPELRTIPRDAVEHYVRAIHATDALRASWSEMPADAAWRELRTTRLTTFVRVGEPDAGERSWSVPLEAGVDIVPERDPTALHEDDVFTVRVVNDGKPAAGLVLAFLSKGESREHVVVTDENGRAESKLDAAGVWLVQCVDVRRVSGPDHDWATSVNAVTFEVSGAVR
jgi:hypothetical protein